MAAGRERQAAEQESARSSLTRRGILAVSAAAVAGIAATRVAQPVEAASDLNYVATGGSGTAFNVATGGYATGVSTTGSNYGLYSSTAGGYAVFAVTTGSNAPNYAGLYGGAAGTGNFGVHGVGSGSTTGVGGKSDSGIGVSGAIPATVGVAPPVPNTAANTIAVEGINQSTGSGGIGVVGQSDVASGAGVKGTSGSGFPVVGSVEGTGSDSNANPALFGKGTAGPGAQGTSNLGHGTVGVSGASDGHAALYGFSNRTGGIALRASMDPMVRTAPFSFAGVFDGTVVISGSLFIGGTKSAYVTHPDGSHRLLYCEESTESWFADYGEGRLTNGKAEIALDPDFAALVETNTLHVFPVAHDEHPLHVAQRSASGFTVAATPDAAAYAKGKKATDLSGTFSYRVVAKRKDVKGERLARFVPPKELPFDAAKATTLPPSPPRKP